MIVSRFGAWGEPCQRDVVSGRCTIPRAAPRDTIARHWRRGVLARATLGIHAGSSGVQVAANQELAFTWSSTI
jgi:hypothetical protein